MNRYDVAAWREDRGIEGGERGRGGFGRKRNGSWLGA